MNGDDAGSQLAWKIVAAVVLLYVIAFALFYPKIPINVDESAYLNQAILISRGQTATYKIHAPSGAVVAHYASDYPIGTAALMAPFILAAGWRGAYVAPLLSLVVGVLLTARWLREAGRSPIFSLLVLGFPPTLVMGRVAMSDVPSLAVVTLGLWLFWRGLRGNWLAWLASGFVAGASLIFRESNVLPFVGFYAGALIRRDRNVWALVVGGLAGVAVRLATSHWIYSDPLHFKGSSAVFMRHGLTGALAFQALGLLVLVPGGLLAAFAYRGARWPELIASVAIFSAFYLAFGYAAVELGFGKRIILGLRFYIPLLPLLAFAVAEVAPRIWQRVIDAATPERAGRIRALTVFVFAVWLSAIALACVAVHPFFDRFTASQVAIRDAIREHVESDTLIISNLLATIEYLPWLEARYGPVNIVDITPQDANQLARRYSKYDLVLLEKSESRFWRDEAQKNAEFKTELRPTPRLVYDERVNDGERLQIWRVGE